MVDDLASDGPDVLSGPGAANEMPDDVVAAARAGAVQSVSPPAWLNKWVWQSLWKGVAVGAATFVLGSVAWRGRVAVGAGGGGGGTQRVVCGVGVTSDHAGEP